MNPEKKPAPLLAKVITYVFCPLFAGAAIYALWQMTKYAGPSGQLSQAAYYVDLLTLVLSVIAFAAGCAFASWRYAVDLMEQKHNVKSSGLQRRARYHEDMLRLVADNIPNALFISDREGRFWFANRDAARLMKCEATEAVGKTIERVFAQRPATMLLDRIRRALGVHAPVITMDRYEDATGPRYMETYHIPLPDTADLHNSVLVTQKDITAVIVERERQEQTFKQLVDTLIAVVDRRDPFAAGHSLRVGIVAQAVAQQMGLDDQNVEACQIAGSLMNLGKILVPREILVKTSALDSNELMQVRKAILTSADILSLISFQTPVVATMRQVLERYDGKGVPEGRKGESILMTSRIVAVANAFIALVSPRAHRAGLSVAEAIGILKKDVSTVYDPRVVEALAVHMETHPALRESLVKPPAELRGLTEDGLKRA